MTLFINKKSYLAAHMSMKVIPLIIILFFAQNLCAQVKDPFPYKFSSTIYAKAKTDSASWRGGVTSSDLSFIGLYKEALQEWDKARKYRRTISREDSAGFVKNYSPADARRFILEKAKKNRVLIFNEAHYNPRHRVFITSLLKELKEAGYSFFAAETFSSREGFQENSKHPNLNSGYYTMEPQFGNLLREANELNFTLYPYEHIVPGNQQARETGQAQNLARLLDSVPGSKLIVLCGFSHIGEDSIANWAVPMAAELKRLTGIDPYTIEQTILSERSATEFNSPYYNLVHTNKYAILVNKKAAPFNKKLDDKKVDALLYAPPTKYIHNRPGWVFENGKIPYFINKDQVQLTFPLIAKVYFTEADMTNTVIPVDILEFRTEEEMVTTAMSVFRKKRFIIELVDTKGETQIVRP
jgi:hypothetical protein